MDASHRKSPLSKRRGRPGFSPSPLSPSLSPQASSVRPRRRLLRPRADEPALPVRFAPARKILGKKKEKKKFRSLELVDPAAWRSRRCPRPSFSSLLKPRAKYPEEADGEELGVEEVPVADHLGHAGPALLHRVPRGPRPGPQRRTRPSRTFRAGLGNSSEEERQTEQFQQASSSSTPARPGGRGAARGGGRGGARGRGAGRARGRRPPGAAPRRRRARPAPRAREGGVAAPVPDRHHQPGPRRGPGPALRGGPAPSARGPRPPRHGPGAGELAVPTPTRWLLRPASRAHRARPRPR